MVPALSNMQQLSYGTGFQSWLNRLRHQNNSVYFIITVNPIHIVPRPSPPNFNKVLEVDDKQK